MPSVSDFLIDRMRTHDIRHVFSVPGDYVLNFVKKLSDSPHIDLVGTTDENHAGFAADAYSRVNGIGCVCVTYNVGALKISNAVACAYAERSPMVVICGSPGIKERGEGMLLHHMVRSFDCQRQMFENITCASTVLDNPNRAGYEIDRVFHALQHHKQPIYIELPRDIADKSIAYDVYKQGTPKYLESDPENLSEALEEIKEWFAKAKSPVILAGVQLARYGLGSELVKFAEKYKIPICTTLLSKSVVGEAHPLYQGLYMGNCSKPEVQKLVEESDCLFMFGVLLTDMTLAFKPAKFKKRQVISSSVEGLQIKAHTYEKVLFKDFCDALFKTELNPAHNWDFDLTKKNNQRSVFMPVKNEKLTTRRMFEKIDSMLTSDMAIVADIGDSLFGASELKVTHRNHFLAPAFYTSMGSAIPGALGVQLAKPGMRPVVIVGDGAFQMSISEISTLLSRKLNPIIFVLNNNGYTTERFLLDGPFNDIASWNYHKVTELFGGGYGVKVQTEEELEEAVSMALSSKELFIINVIVDSHDVSPALKRMTEGLVKRV